MKKTIILLSMILCTASVLPIHAQQTDMQQTKEMLQQMRFKFTPDNLQGEGFGEVNGYYENGDGFPLWLLLEMDGPVVVTPESFSIDNTVSSDTLWSIDMTSVDTLNGACKSQIAIDPRDSRAALTVITPQESVTYLGRISPIQDTQRTYKNDRVAAEAPQTEKLLDEIISKLNFQVSLNSETYGRRAVVVIDTTSKIVVNTAKNIVSFNSEIICAQKVGDYWYVSVEVPAKNKVAEPLVIDLIIDAKTGDTNYRCAPWNAQPKNWRNMVDGNAQVKDVTRKYNKM